ncbi:MAG: acetate--CoA ligase family protein [Syntrophales bacterium]|nr:acetate--CoA ligase family protein [Syntrophales bacterium]
MKGLDAIFAPRTVAVVGASTTPGKVGHDIFANILRGGYTGTLYPVTRSGGSVLSVKAYASIGDVPDDVDLAIIILSPRLAVKAVEDSIAKGVGGIVIVSAGFREVGGEGLEIENRITAMCREAGVRLVGPNCLGVINPVAAVSMNASFSARMPASGDISFISQSGALCTAVLDFAYERDFGFSKFISTGNKADVDELDLLLYLHDDLDTKVIMLYLEELRRGHEFIEAVRNITSGDRPMPILAIKSGRTAEGARAAASHTGSLAGTDAVYDAIFEQSGIIRVDSVDELFDFANAFSYKHESVLGKQSRKDPRGNRVAIITNAGGPGILATDMTLSSGLRLAQFRKETVDELMRHLPLTANLRNPVDVIGDAPADRYERALAAVINDDGVDGALVLLTPQSMTNALGTAEAIVRIARRSNKPIISCFMGIIDVSAGVNYLQEHGYPVYRFPENAAKAFGALYRYSNWLSRRYSCSEEFPFRHDRSEASSLIRKHLQSGKTYLGELEGQELLAAYGFNIPPAEFAADEGDAAASAERIGYPVVMKIVSPQILHKSDAGGVRIGIRDAAAVKEAFRAIVENARSYDPAAGIKGVLVRKMAPAGQEVILGMNRYPIFGPLLMFGMGGIFVEVYRDVTFRLAPICRLDAREMIRHIRGHKLLEGFRGQPKADQDAIEQCIVRMSDLASDQPEIAEMDINPLIVHPEGQGATVADCRIILSQRR